MFGSGNCAIRDTVQVLVQVQVSHLTETTDVHNRQVGISGNVSKLEDSSSILTQELKSISAPSCLCKSRDGRTNMIGHKQPMSQGGWRFSHCSPGPLGLASGIFSLWVVCALAGTRPGDLNKVKNKNNADSKSYPETRNKKC